MQTDPGAHDEQDDVPNEEDPSTRQALVDAGEGTLDAEGRPIDDDDVTILRGIDEDDWTGPTGP